MQTAFFDIETDGLDANRVHCICAMLDNGESTMYNFIGKNNLENTLSWEIKTLEIK